MSNAVDEDPESKVASAKQEVSSDNLKSELQRLTEDLSVGKDAAFTEDGQYEFKSKITQFIIEYRRVAKSIAASKGDRKISTSHLIEAYEQVRTRPMPWWPLMANAFGGALFGGGLSNLNSLLSQEKINHGAAYCCAACIAIGALLIGSSLPHKGRRA